MLDLDQSLRVQQWSVFADHAAPDTFYWAPDAPRLAGDQLSLLMFREPHEGGFLTIATTLEPPAGERDQLAAALEQRVGRPANVVPIPFVSGSAQLLVPGAQNADGMWVAGPVLGVATPSLLGSQRAIFGAELTKAGASLARAYLAGETVLGIAVAYELRFHGLARARHARIELDYEAAYEAVVGGGAAVTLWVKADVDAAVESLIASGALRIEDVSTEELDPAARAARHDELIAEARRFATDTLWADVPAALAPSTATSPAPTRSVLRVRARRTDERRTLRYDLSVSGVRTRTIAPQGLIAIDAELHPAERIRTVDGDQWFAEPRPFTAVVVGADGWAGVERAVVDVRQDDTVHTIELSPETPSGSILLPPGEREVRTRLKTVDDPSALETEPAAASSPGGRPDTGESAALEEPPWQPHDGWHQVIEPATLAKRRRVALVIGHVAGDVVDGVDVIARSRGPRGAARELRLSTVAPEADLVVIGSDPIDVHAEFHLRASDGAPVVVALDRPVEVDDRLVILNPPAAVLRTVTAMLADPLERYLAVFVDVERADGLGARTLRLSRAEPRATWSYFEESASHAYRYRERRSAVDGSMSEGEWIDTTRALVVVGDTTTRVAPIQLIALAAPDHVGGVARVETLSALPPGVSPVVDAFLDPGQRLLALRLAYLEGEPLRFRASMELFTAAGDVVTLGPIETADEIVVMRHPAVT